MSSRSPWVCAEGGGRGWTEDAQHLCGAFPQSLGGCGGQGEEAEAWLVSRCEHAVSDPLCVDQPQMIQTGIRSRTVENFNY